MDLSAAVDSTYMVQFTNAGMYVLNKTTGSPVNAVGLWNFWCGVGVVGVNGLPLNDCPSSQPTAPSPIPIDVQIAHTSVYPGGRWVVTTMSPDQTYLWLGISKTNDPLGSWHLWSFQGCQDYKNTPTPYPYMDQPILGVSRNRPGGPGRLVVDMTCWTSNTPPATVGPDDIYDFNLNWLAQGNDVTAPPKTFCAVSGAACNVPSLDVSQPIVEVRPVNHNIGGGGSRGVLLSAVVVPNPSPCTAGKCGTPRLWVYQLALGSTAASDGLNLYNKFTLTGLTVAVEREPEVAQTETSGLQPIMVDELQTDDGDVIENDHNGDNYFATSFTALAPDATMSNGVYTSGDSYYVVFVLNLKNGNFHEFVSPVTGEIASYSNAVIDSDDELWVNYTLFPFSSPPLVNEDEYDYYPLGGPPGYINTYRFVDSTQSGGIVAECTKNPPYCRWGDYNAQVIDGSCDAFNATNLTPKPPECGLVWGTSEYVYTPTNNVSFGSGVPECLATKECQASQAIAFYDDTTTDDTNDIKFVGSSTTESECPNGGACSLSIYPPSGVEPGDVLLVAFAASDAGQYVPTMPSGWQALAFKNQSGSQNFNSYDKDGDKETGWLLTYVYGHLGKNEPSYYTFSERVATGGELTALMLAYRGVGTSDVGSFLAKGNGASASDNLTVTTGKVTAGADEKLVVVFHDGGDECGGADFSGDSTFSSPTPSGLNMMTPLTVSGNVLTGFAAQLSSGSGGTFGKYSSTVSAPACPATFSIPLAWMVLLPSE